jgi:predicted metal-dependent peptidase
MNISTANVMASGSALTPAQRVSRAVNTISRDPELRAFATLVMFTNIELTDRVSTAATDGRRTYISPAFIETQLSDSDLVFVLMHEALHVGFNHLIAWRHLYNIDKRRANAACDYVINLMLHDLTEKTRAITMPVEKSGPETGQAIGLLDEQYRGMDTKQVFDLLGKQQQQQQQKGQGQGGVPDSFDDHDWEQIIQQGLHAAGMTGGSAPRELLDHLAVRTDWREIMRDFVKTTTSKEYDNTTWRRYNRRLLGTGIYMPSTYAGVLGEIIVAIDTSGSIDVPALNEFASNVVAICEDLLPAKLTVIYWDAIVQHVEEYEPGDYGDLISSTRPVGGGGTVPTCIKDYITENDLSPEALLVFTDGVFYGDSVDFGDIPTLWCLDQNYYKHFTPPCGSAVEILI